MKLENYLDEIVAFLKDYKEKAHADGYILGVSGGIDSALCAFLIKKACPDNCLGLILPCYSNPQDEIDALKVCKAANLDFKTISLNETFDSIKKSIISSFGVENSKLALANTKARLRMSTLYAVGQMHNYLVVGTDNLNERYAGYFTKHGDGACDVMPIAYLTKGEVKEAARLLGVPKEIIDKRPTAGLIADSYDEDELGITYADFDKFLLGQKIAEAKEEHLQDLHRKSEHKRLPAATPKPYNR